MPGIYVLVLILIQSLLANALSIDKITGQKTGRKPRRSLGPAKILPEAHGEFNSEYYDNDGIHLALSPACSFDRAGDVNTGIDWSKIRTMVAFGDSYTQVGNGGDGSPPPTIHFVGKNPSASGRSTNGETWVEQLLRFNEGTNQSRALFSYARSGATTDNEIWSSRRWADDFPSQLSRLYANNTEQHLDPETTLYVGYFGITDFWSINTDGDQMYRAGRRAAQLIRELQEHTAARNILWLGVQFSQDNTAEYNSAVWNGLRNLYVERRINFAFVNTGRFFSTIHESFVDFGYVSSKHCLAGQRSSIEDECEDPERTVYYMGAHPSRQTHRILAEYVMNVIKECYAVEESYASLTSYRSRMNNPLSHYITTGHLFFLSILLIAVCANRPIARAARKFAYGMGDIVLTSPRQPSV